MGFWYPDLTAKEDLQLSFDFSTMLASGATISAATITRTNPDATTTNVSTSISGQTVVFSVSTLAAGLYHFECLATSSSKIYEQTGHLRVVA